MTPTIIEIEPETGSAERPSRQSVRHIPTRFSEMTPTFVLKRRLSNVIGWVPGVIAAICGISALRKLVVGTVFADELISTPLDRSSTGYITIMRIRQSAGHHLY